MAENNPTSSESSSYTTAPTSFKPGSDSDSHSNLSEAPPSTAVVRDNIAQLFAKDLTEAVAEDVVNALEKYVALVQEEAVAEVHVSEAVVHEDVAQAQEEGVAQAQEEGVAQAQEKDVAQAQEEVVAHAQEENVAQAQEEDVVQAQGEDVAQAEGDEEEGDWWPWRKGAMITLRFNYLTYTEDLNDKDALDAYLRENMPYYSLATLRQKREEYERSVQTSSK